MATQAELAADLREAVDQLKKSQGEIAVVQTETTTLKAKVQELEDALANQDQASQDLTDAVEAVKAQVQIVDDAIPDVTPLP